MTTQQEVSERDLEIGRLEDGDHPRLGCGWRAASCGRAECAVDECHGRG